MSAMDDFYQQQITSTKELILAYQTAVAALVAGQIESYEIDTGQTKTIVKRHNLNMLNAQIDVLMNRLATLSARVDGGNVVQVMPAW